MGTWLAIDHGTKRVGLAIGSTETGIATPLKVIPAEPFHLTLSSIAQIAASNECVGIVVGWPLNMDDSEGPQGVIARKAALEIADATALDVRMWDERLSSFAADQVLAGKLTRKKKRQRQDAVAAAEILQDFLSSGGPDGAPRPDEIV